MPFLYIFALFYPDTTDHERDNALLILRWLREKPASLWIELDTPA